MRKEKAETEKETTTLMSYAKSQPPVLHSDVSYDEDRRNELKKCLSLMLYTEDCDGFVTHARESQLDDDQMRTLLDEDDGKSTFLQSACSVPQHKNVVEFLLAKFVDPNRTTRGGNESPPLVIAAEQRNYDVMRMLLDAKVDVDPKDGNGNTALHVVANNRNLGMVVRLLNTGARLDVKNNLGQEPISTAIMMDLMDMSLQAEETTLPRQDRIKMDFGLFIQRQSATSAEFSTHGPAEVSHVRSESARLCYITETHKETCILTHPLVKTYLHLKWSRISWFYYANLVWATMFTVLLNIFIVMDGNEDRLRSNIASMILKVLITIFWSGIVFRELVRLSQDFRKYICNTENILVVAVIVCTALSVFVKWDHEDMRLTFYLLTALLSWSELFVFSGKMPALSDYLEIFKMVARNHSVLTLYSMLFATFALAFYLVVRTSGEIFPAVGPALFTMKMSHVNTVLLVSNFVFFVFVFMGIVQVNLRLSLATKGILKIKAAASLFSVRSRLRLVSDIENSLMITHTLGIPIISRMFSVDEIMIFPEGCSDDSAYIYPDYNSDVIVGDRILSMDRNVIAETMKIIATSSGAKKEKWANQ